MNEVIDDTKQKLKSLAIKSVLHPILIANYWLNHYKEVIWLIGDGRSGTTWVSSLINHNQVYREMFEPFHPSLIKKMKFLHPHQYLRSDESNEQLEGIAADVFTGKFTHPRVDSQNRRLSYQGLLIKDIFANLFSNWASIRFPNIKTILLLRNPFSVALSKSKTRNWHWHTEPEDFLKQDNLYHDYLGPLEDLIRKVSHEGNYIQCQILIWAIINYIPLRQFTPGQIHIVFYENIFADPRHEISKIFRFIRSPEERRPISISENLITEPSFISGPGSNIHQGTSPITSWKQQISTRNIDEGLKTLERFGFEKLYDEKSMPNREVLDKVHEM